MDNWIVQSDTAFTLIPGRNYLIPDTLTASRNIALPAHHNGGTASSGHTWLLVNNTSAFNVTVTPPATQRFYQDGDTALTIAAAYTLTPGVLHLITSKTANREWNLYPFPELVASSVTLAMMADMATASLIGRNTAGTGVPEVLSKTTVLSLLNVEDGADVTDATNVAAAGATMDSDASLAGNSYFLDDDAFSADSATQVASQQSIKAYVDAAGGGLTPVYKIASYTVVAGEFVLVDSGGTDRTITAPATIAVNDRFAVHHFNTSGTPATVTVARNSHTLRYQGDTNGKAGGAATDITLSDGQTVHFIASDSTNLEIV